jgi:hypothetical protein
MQLPGSFGRPEFESWGGFRGSVKADFAVSGRLEASFFSIIQRKVLTPNDFHDLDAVAERIIAFQDYWQTTGTPFDWKYTSTDLNHLLDRITTHEPLAAAA